MVFAAIRGNLRNRIMAAGLAGMSAVAPGTSVRAQAVAETAAAPVSAVVSLSVPAGSLEAALISLGRQTSLRLIYPSEITRGKRTGGVRGTLAPQDALGRVLAGTGLAYRFTNANTVTIVDPTTASGAALGRDGSLVLDTINVEGQGESAWGPVEGIIARNSASGTRTETPIVETPQTVNVVGGTQMQEQGVSTVGEALRYTPGVVTGTAGGQADRHDAYFVRGEGGFSAAAQYASTLDGLRWRFSDRTSVQVDPWMLERVEVVKGPSSVLFGAGRPGGEVNLVSKRPSFERRNHVFAGIGNYDSGGAGFDFAGPINDQFAYRLIGLGRVDGNGVDFQKGERLLIAPSLTWAPTDATSVTLSAIYQRDPKAADAGFVPAYGSVLSIPGYGKVPASFWQGDPDWNEYNRTETAVGLEVKHSFTENWKVTGKMRYGRLESTTRAMDYTGMGYYDPSWNWVADPFLMSRTVYLAEHDNKSFSGDFYTEGKFSTGAAENTVVFGIDHQRLSGGHKDGWDQSQYPIIDIFHPVRGITPNAFDTFRFFEQPFQQTGLYAQDQIAIGNWRFLGGLRYDSVKATASSAMPARNLYSTASASDSKMTGRIGAVYLFDNGFAPFVSYSTSFNPQPSFRSDGTLLKPYSGKMWEGGLRYQSQDGSLFWSVAAFSGTKDGVGAQTACTFPGATQIDRCFTEDTKAKSKGIELEARAQLASGLDLIAAATWQNVRWKEYMEQSVDYHVVGVPDYTASLWLNYRIPEGQIGHGFSLGGGIRYVGSTYATMDNKWGATEYEYAGQPSKVPSFTLFDASIGYDFATLGKQYEGLEARLNVANLFDKHYVAACNGYGTCSYGKRREISLKLNYTW